MPIIVPQVGSSAAPVPSSQATTLVSTIISLVQEDLQERFLSSGSTNVLIDYTNRIQQMILGQRQWSWMTSAPKRFITERGQSDYWIGSTGAQAAGQVDTLLNLPDVRRVKHGAVLSRTGFKLLHSEDEGPNWKTWQFEDASYREGTPTEYRNDPESPNVVSIYPAPDTGSVYPLVPPAPHSTTATSGALAARTYYLRTTFVDLAGNESSASTTARQFVEANKALTVRAPQPAITVGSAGVSYLRYNVYASTTEDSEKKQNATPTATSSNWTEPGGGLTSTGAAAPETSTLEPLRGYVIELRYYKLHAALTATGDTVLIPDAFRDVVVAGVNWLGCEYLKDFDRANRWRAVFNEGTMRLVRDEHPFGKMQYVAPGGYTGRRWA